MARVPFFVRTALAAGVIALTLGAQAPPRNIPQPAVSERAAALEDLDRIPERDRERDRSAEAKKQRELMGRLTEFATVWNGLMKGCEKGVWDAKKATQARKAFERLVESPAWIEKDKSR